MQTTIVLLDRTVDVIRTIFGALALIAVVFAALAWGVRTRRISPFSALGRFTRRAIEPLLIPVDRWVARAGGNAAGTPWWGLVFLLIGGFATLFVLDVVRSTLMSIGVASSGGAGDLFRLLVSWSFGLLQIALLVRVITSWVGGTHSWIGRTATRLTEWFLAPLRRALPPMGAIDISPLIAWVLLKILASIVLSVL